MRDKKRQYLYFTIKKFEYQKGIMDLNLFERFLKTYYAVAECMCIYVKIDNQVNVQISSTAYVCMYIWRRSQVQGVRINLYYRHRQWDSQ